MKKRLISLIVISALSLSSLVSCGEKVDKVKDTTPNETVEDTTSSKDETTKDETTKDETTKDDTIETEDTDNETNNDGIVTESLIKETFTNALNELYNLDYSVKEDKGFAKEYARSKFSEKGSEEFIKKISGYNSQFEVSDILITKVSEIKNSNSSYVKSYEIRYNVTITEGKPSIYSDLKGIVVEDINGNLFIDSINKNNF